MKASDKFRVKGNIPKVRCDGYAHAVPMHDLMPSYCKILLTFIEPDRGSGLTIQMSREEALKLHAELTTAIRDTR